MSMQALAGLDDFVRQVNSKLAEIPREITVQVSGLAGSNAPTSQRSQARGSMLSAAQIEAAAYTGAQRALTEAGRGADIRIRMG